MDQRVTNRHVHWDWALGFQKDWTEVLKEVHRREIHQPHFSTLNKLKTNFDNSSANVSWFIVQGGSILHVAPQALQLTATHKTLFGLGDASEVEDTLHSYTRYTRLHGLSIELERFLE